MIKLKNREEKEKLKKKQKLYQPYFKTKIALEALREEKTLAQISGEHDMHINNVINWKKEAIENLPLLFNRSNKEKAQPNRS